MDSFRVLIERFADSDSWIAPLEALRALHIGEILDLGPPDLYGSNTGTSVHNPISLMCRPPRASRGVIHESLSAKLSIRTRKLSRNMIILE